MMARRLLLKVRHSGFPPTVNHLYRSMRDGRRYKTQEGRDYQEGMTAMMAVMKKAKEPYSGDVSLKLSFTAKDKRRWDIDNRVKAVQDCLAPSGVILDDRQIVSLNVRRLQGNADETVIELREA